MEILIGTTLRQLNEHLHQKLDSISEFLQRKPEQVMDEALELYFKTEREKLLDKELEAHRKETNLSYDEFWSDLDFDEEDK